jgi:hypothetical protein
MNHTGVHEVGRLAQAARKGASAGADIWCARYGRLGAEENGVRGG